MVWNPRTLHSRLISLDLQNVNGGEFIAYETLKVSKLCQGQWPLESSIKFLDWDFVKTLMQYISYLIMGGLLYTIKTLNNNHCFRLNRVQ